jgi:mxaJ protein
MCSHFDSTADQPELTQISTAPGDSSAAGGASSSSFSSILVRVQSCSSVVRSLVLFVGVLSAFICPPLNAQTNERVLHVAADPNNLPFSNDRLEGFENRIAELVARELHARLEYTWRAQRRGFFRETLKEGNCDLVLGIPSDSEMALTTKPYYRSSYVFVFPKNRSLAIRSLDDPKLRTLRIGVPVAGDVGGNTPPIQALAARGIVTNVVGFTVFGNYSEANPPARIVEAVAKGEVDLAIVWGPLAGFFARKSSVPLEVVPVTPSIDSSGQPLAFDISMGVRRNAKVLRDEIDGTLTHCHEEIEAVLDEYGVPRLTEAKVASQTAERDHER